MSNHSKKARIVRFTQTGGPEVLTIETVEIPSPGPQEVRIQVKAIGLNRADTMYRRGFYDELPIFPAGLGYEAAGIVEAVGEAVKDVVEGDVVSVLPAFSLHQYATYGELIVVPAYTLQKHPSILSFEEAASVWTSFLTMYGMVADTAGLQPGQSVVITAASSSAGLAAIQVVNYLGGVSIAVTTTAKKRDALLRAGATHVIAVDEQDIAAQVLKLTDNKGADVILDPVAGPMLPRLVKAIAFKGKIFIYGALSQEPVQFPTLEVMQKMPVIYGYNAMDVLANPVKLQAAIRFITDGVTRGRLKPIVGKTFPFDKIVEATQFLEANTHTGKIVVTV
jgi:NADPH:quinone reductase-like Zn-dependent oxidoreductase